MADERRSIPRTDVILADPRLAEPQRRLGREFVRLAVAGVQAEVRSGRAIADLAGHVAGSLPATACSLRPVINATGVVLHTNLGRAPLSAAAVEAVVAAAGYTDVEFDLAAGTRAARGRGVLAALRAALPDAGDVHVVNNGAAALVLAITALAQGRDVVWSRGEMVEIGDGFRLPDLVASTGVRVVEVGTTNRTRREDFLAALTERTGAVLKVHPSNFRVEGFTAQPRVAELAGLGPPLVVDVGSGLLAGLPLLPEEPDMASALRAGADVVTASADKLLGGPQAGILAGRADIIARIRRHPLARALRVDKLTLAALEATLRGPAPPTATALASSSDELLARAQAMASALGADVVASDGVTGGGGAPGVALPGWAVSLPAELAAPLRTGEPPVVGRVERGRTLIDLRCVPPSQDEAVTRAIRTARSRPAP